MGGGSLRAPALPLCSPTLAPPRHPPPPRARSFLGTLYSRGMSCTRFYYMTWYEKFKRGMGGRSGFVAPYWDGPEVPIWNRTHDLQVQEWRDERRRREAVL